MLVVDKKILIVDDEIQNIELAEIVLKKEGYSLYFAETAQACFEIIYKENIDLLVLDLMLPDMNGFEVLEKIKQEDIKVDVIIVSALSDTQTIQKTQKLGASDYLIKPYDIISLKSKVRNIIAKVNLDKKDVEEYLNIFFKKISMENNQVFFKTVTKEFLMEDIDAEIVFIMSYLTWFIEKDNNSFIYAKSKLIVNEFSLVGERKLDILQNRLNTVLVKLYTNGVNQSVLMQCRKYFLS